MKRATALAVLLVVAACSSDPLATASSDVAFKPTGPLAVSLIVSDPGIPTSNPAGSAAHSAAAMVVYVSLPPGILPDSASVRIANLRTADAVTPAVVEGGFDPIAIPATAGDTLDVAVTEGSGATSHTQVVAVRARPPRVVRTSPPKGQNDVPLNAVIVIVISEPIDPTTVNPNGIRLRLGAESVAGSLVLDQAGTIVHFTPTSALLPNSDYEIDVTQALTDLTGSPLEAAATVPFTTMAAELPASQLSFMVQPTNIQAGSIMAPAVRVTALDNAGHWAAGYAGTVTLAIRDDGVGLGTLLGTLSVAAVNGIATFSDLSVDMISISTFLYTLTASADGLTSAVSAGFAVGPGPVRGVKFLSQPVNAVQGMQMLSVEVALTDSLGNQVGDDYAGSISLAIGTNPEGGALSGTTQQPYDGTQGLHPFSDLHIDRAGSGYTLVASGLGLKPDTSLSFDVAPTTDLIAVSSGWLGVLDADGRGLGILGTGNSPAWSPDGAKIAFTRGVPWFDQEILVVNADGFGVASLGQSGLSPAWSPDGAKIAFSSSRTGIGELYVMNTDGSRVATLGQTGDHPAWSPDGTRIAFSSNRNGPSAIYVMNADGSGVTQLTTPLPSVDAGDFSPAWSPDGTKIAFSRAFQSTGDFTPYFIFVMNADGSALTTLGQMGSNPSWSPDGSRIAYELYLAAGIGDSPAVYIMNADGSGSRPVGAFEQRIGWIGSHCRSAAMDCSTAIGVGSPAWRPRPRP